MTSPPRFQDFFDRFYITSLVGYRVTPMWKIAVGRFVGYLSVPLLLLPVLSRTFVGLPVMFRRWRWPFAVALPLLLLGYLLFYSMLGQYLWMATLALALVVVRGRSALACNRVHQRSIPAYSVAYRCDAGPRLCHRGGSDCHAATSL